METTPVVALMRTLSSAASRRGVLAGLTGGSLATGIVSLGEDEAEARRKGKRKRRKNRRNEQRSKIRVDVTCPGSGAIGLGANSGDSRIAQTFTASRSGALVKAQLLISQNPGTAGDYVLRLSLLDATRTSTNAVLAEATVANNEVPVDGGAIDFLFADPFSVVAGVEYALALTRPEGDEFFWMGESDNPCGGSSFFSEDQTEPFEPNSADFDHTFTTFVKS